MGKFKQIAVSLILSTALVPMAHAQTVTTQDVSQQLQSSLEASVPTIVYFGFDKDDLTSDAQAVLVQQGAWLMSNPNAKVNLAGHTDAVGSNAYNDNLAMRRAQSVERFLISQGVNPAQMQSVVSRGEAELAVATQDKERLNRRVTTGVTGLVEVITDVPPPPPPPPPPIAKRSYTDATPLVCTVGSGTSLTAMTDMTALRGELQSRLEMADGVYKSAEAMTGTSNRFNLAAFTKTECGIAIGFTKSGIMDERSVTHCACSSQALGKQVL